MKYFHWLIGVVIQEMIAWNHQYIKIYRKNLTVLEIVTTMSLNSTTNNNTLRTLIRVIKETSTEPG